MTVTCHTHAQAVKLKALIDEAGNLMPSRAVLDAYGLLWVLGEEAEEPAASAVTVSQLCSLYLAAKEACPKPPSPQCWAGSRLRRVARASTVGSGGLSRDQGR